MIFDDSSGDPVLGSIPVPLSDTFWIDSNCGALTGDDSFGPTGGMVGLMELAWMIAEASGD